MVIQSNKLIGIDPNTGKDISFDDFNEVIKAEFKARVFLSEEKQEALIRELCEKYKVTEPFTKYDHVMGIRNKYAKPGEKVEDYKGPEAKTIITITNPLTKQIISKEEITMTDNNTTSKTLTQDQIDALNAQAASGGDRSIDETIANINASGGSSESTSDWMSHKVAAVSGSLISSAVVVATKGLNVQNVALAAVAAAASFGAGHYLDKKVNNDVVMLGASALMGGVISQTTHALGDIVVNKVSPIVQRDMDEAVEAVTPLIGVKENPTDLV